MKSLRLQFLALLGGLAILVGSLMPATAVPCAEGAAMSCDVCLDGVLSGSPGCAAAGQAVTASDPASRPARVESPVWFGAPSVRPYGVDRPPESPPPR